MIPPTSSFFNGDSLLASFSSMGIAKARVLPEPVTAWTTTSLCWLRKRGMTEAWTGVIEEKPSDCKVSEL